MLRSDHREHLNQGSIFCICFCVDFKDIKICCQILIWAPPPSALEPPTPQVALTGWWTFQNKIWRDYVKLFIEIKPCLYSIAFLYLVEFICWNNVEAVMVWLASFSYRWEHCKSKYLTMTLFTLFLIHSIWKVKPTWVQYSVLSSHIADSTARWDSAAHSKQVRQTNLPRQRRNF